MTSSASLTSPASFVFSVYIPIIGDKITNAFIEKSFLEKKIGVVTRVDFVLNKRKFRREAFVHFSEWFTSDEANLLKADLLNDQTQTRFVYKGKEFWPLLINKNPIEKYSPERKANSAYELEDRIDIIRKDLDNLTFMSKVHDANICYILRKTNLSTPEVNPANPAKPLTVVSAQIKRQKTDDDGEFVSLNTNNKKRNYNTNHTCNNLTLAWYPDFPSNNQTTTTEAIMANSDN